MTIKELLKEAKLTSITEVEVEKLRTRLIQQGIIEEKQERRNSSSEVLNRIYSI